jgi:hypothetical protein
MPFYERGPVRITTKRSVPASPCCSSKAEVTIYPWKDSQAHTDEVVEHARRFLKAHEPVTAGRQGR